MSSFSPPATDRTPTDYIGGNDQYYPSPQPIRTLMGRYRGNLKAPNVFRLTALGASQNGGVTYTTSQPWEGEPGSVISFVYYGSATYTVTDAEAAALTAAGFGAGVS